MSRALWNERYQSGDAPWDVGVADEHLVELVETGRVAPGRALEVGCGTGTNARWLAEHGFSVVGVDLSSLAIDQAKAAPVPNRGSLTLHSLNFLEDDVPGGPFELVFDRGCFHVFDEARDRARFAEHVEKLLAPGGLWLSLIGSTEGAERDHGPPRRSLRDVATAVEPFLAVVELRATLFRAHHPAPAPAWLCLSQKRTMPAQPSTKRAPGEQLARPPSNS